MSKEVILAAIDTINQIIEQTLTQLPDLQLSANYRQLQTELATIPQHIVRSFEPIREFFANVSQQLEDGQRYVKKTVGYIEQQMKMESLRG
jgi:hypothetical protein